METETLGDTVGDVETDTLIDTPAADTVAEVEAE